MDRFEFEDLISAYIENDLPLIKRKEVEAYLYKNPSQNQLVKQIVNNMKALKKSPKISSTNNFNKKLIERIKSNDRGINSTITNRGNIFGFSFLNASALLGLICLFLVLGFEITGLTPTLKNNDRYRLTDNKKFSGKNEVTKLNKIDNSNQNLTTLQNDTTKKEKIDFSRNIKYVND